PDHFKVEKAGGGSIPAQTAGTAFSIRITARTSVDALDTGFTGKVNITSTGTLSAGGGTTTSFQSGALDPWNVTISNTGNFTITATRASGTQNGVSNVFSVTAGSATQLVFGTQPTSTSAGTAISPAVTVQIKDANGNLTNSTATVVMAIGTNPAGGVLS